MSKFKILLSYLFPVPLGRFRSLQHNYLKLELYKGQYRLSTKSAYYSYGKLYEPFLHTYQFLNEKDLIKNINAVLILGVGLGSNIELFEDFGGVSNRTFDLVELDATILGMAEVLLKEKFNDLKYESFNENALKYVDSCNRKYDLINLDVFVNRIVPKEFIEPTFIKNIHGLLLPEGILIFNYMQHDKVEYAHVMNTIKKTFKKVKVLYFNQNRFFICFK